MKLKTILLTTALLAPSAFADLPAWKVQFDTDKDGVISPEEQANMEKIMAQRQAIRAERIKLGGLLLQKFDVDKDSYITGAEVQPAAEFLAKGRKFLLKKHDKDKNGRLSKDEATALFNDFGSKCLQGYKKQQDKKETTTKAK